MSDRDAESARDALRAKLAEAIPDSYSPVLHFACTAGVGLVALVSAAFSIHGVRPIELLVVPFVFVLANGVEWRAHKSLLHHRTPPLHELYDRHTPQHHMVFQYHDMAIRSRKELKLVLIPAVGVLGVVIMTAGPAWAIGHFLGANVGWLFLLTGALYVVTYELTHLAYHLPEDTFVGRLGFIRVMREHHARHHDPRLMQRWNFNVTVPLFDLLHGTIAPPAVIEKARAKVGEAARSA
jgi:hypothetical protein